MNKKTIISCALTGSAPTPEKNPAVPVTPEEIANSALEAEQAGAAIVHIHVRDPETARRSMKVEHYAEVVERIREAASKLIINLTTGPGARFVPGSQDPAVAGEGTLLKSAAIRVRHIEELKPEICSLDIATMNFRDAVFMNTPDILRDMAGRARKAGAKPELEVFDSGHIELAKQLISEDLIAAPPYFQLCLGVAYGAPATPQSMLHLQSQLPQGAVWSAFGVGRNQFPMVAQAVLLGGHVRVGFEDNLYLEAGTLAPSNAALVNKAAGIIRALGSDVATPDEARGLLGLRV
jgi:uncharacterized protein (DUF849 family)